MLHAPHLAYILYLRKSDKDRDDVIKSIEDQRAYCSAEAERHDLAVVLTYEENQTAKIPGIRPLYNQMIADLKAKKANAILVYHVNRLARNVEEAGALAQMLLDGKVQEIRTPTSVYRSGQNILPLLIEQGNSAQFSVDLSRRMKDAVEQTSANGGWPRGAPIGYKNERHPLYPKKSIILPDPERFPHVRRLFDLFLTGRYSARQLLEIASDQWGLRLRATAFYPERPLIQSTLYHILKNPFYAGLVRHHGVQYKGNHQPMLTIAEFNRVQKLLANRTVVRRRKHDFTYSGLVQCGYCGQQVVGEHHRRAGRLNIYYRCADTYGRCTKRGIREDVLEDAILGVLSRLHLHPEVGQVILDGLTRWEAVRHHAAVQIASQQQRTLHEIEKQRRSLLDLMVRGVIPDEDLFRQKQAELLAERNRVQASVLAQQQSGGREVEKAQEALTFMQRSREEFRVALPPLRKAIAQCVATYTLAGNELSIEVDPLLEAMANHGRQISGMFEPGFDGSGTDDPGGFSAPFQFGVPNCSLFEPPEELLLLLQEHSFRSPLGDQELLRAA